MAVVVDPRAAIDPTAEIGVDVEVRPYAVIGPNVAIGDRSVVGSHAQIQGPTVLGEENRVYGNACIGFAPQDLKYRGEDTRLEIGARNHLREFCSIHRGTVGGGGVTTIGDDNLLMAYSHIAHDCHVGSHTVFANAGTLAGHVEVGDWAVVGAFTSIQQFLRVGAHAYIGGYSTLRLDALPFARTSGMKAAFIGINRIGLARRGFSAESIEALDRALRILTRSKLKVEDAVARMRREVGGVAEVEELARFVEESERGVIRNTPRRRAE